MSKSTSSTTSPITTSPIMFSCLQMSSDNSQSGDAPIPRFSASPFPLSDSALRFLASPFLRCGSVLGARGSALRFPDSPILRFTLSLFSRCSDSPFHHGQSAICNLQCDELLPCSRAQQCTPAPLHPCTPAPLHPGSNVASRFTLRVLRCHSTFRIPHSAFERTSNLEQCPTP